MITVAVVGVGVAEGMVEAGAEGTLVGVEVVAEGVQALLADLVTGHAQAAATIALPASRHSTRAAYCLIDLICTHRDRVTNAHLA